MELARAVGISDMTLSKIETGKTKSVTIDTGKGIASALGVSFADLFGVEPSKTENGNDLYKEVERMNLLIEQLKSRIIELEEQLNDKRKLILSYEGTVTYWNLFSKYSRILIAENNEISAIELENRVLAKIYKDDGPFVINVDNEKNWSFLFDGNRPAD